MKITLPQLGDRWLSQSSGASFVLSKLDDKNMNILYHTGCEVNTFSDFFYKFIIDFKEKLISRGNEV